MSISSCSHSSDLIAQRKNMKLEEVEVTCSSTQLENNRAGFQIQDSVLFSSVAQ